jgi:hypothetical protein
MSCTDGHSIAWASMGGGAVPRTMATAQWNGDVRLTGQLLKTTWQEYQAHIAAQGQPGAVPCRPGCPCDGPGKLVVQLCHTMGVDPEQMSDENWEGLTQFILPGQPSYRIQPPGGLPDEP